MKAMKASKMHHRKKGRRIGEYSVLRRKDLEGHANCLQIFAGLCIVSVAPAVIISKTGIIMIKANASYNVRTYFEAATSVQAL